jgi:hypothetical protein
MGTSGDQGWSSLAGCTVTVARRLLPLAAGEEPVTRLSNAGHPAAGRSGIGPGTSRHDGLHATRLVIA